MDQNRAAEEFASAFGLALREVRNRLEISQEELCARTELDRTYISEIERGLRNPTLKVLWKLSTALKTRPNKLIALTERKMR